MYKALVTGGTRGIGLAIADSLRSHGYEVFVCARDARADVQCDVTKSAEVTAMRDRIGPVDILVNNVGGVTTSPFLKVSEEEWDHHFQLNVKSVFYCVQAFLPSMVERKWGRVINIASTAGRRGYRYVSAYVASKHAVVGLTRALALETAQQGVTVNAICPSFVDTPMLRQSAQVISAKTGKSPEDLMAAYSDHNPQKRLITPEEVASAVQFLIDTPAVNGQAITLCGGEIVV